MAFNHYFELHITIKPEDLEIASSLIPKAFGVHYSSIYADPELGTYKYSYITGRGTEYPRLWETSIEILKILRTNGINPIRRKIESTIVDDFL